MQLYTIDKSEFENEKYVKMEVKDNVFILRS